MREGIEMGEDGLEAWVGWSRRRRFGLEVKANTLCVFSCRCLDGFYVVYSVVIS